LFGSLLINRLLTTVSGCAGKKRKVVKKGIGRRGKNGVMSSPNQILMGLDAPDKKRKRGGEKGEPRHIDLILLKGERA